MLFPDLFHAHLIKQYEQEKQQDPLRKHPLAQDRQKRGELFRKGSGGHACGDLRRFQ